jgi:hypothetical protein
VQLAPEARQAAHAAPLFPHALVEVPVMQVVPEQQPVQLPGPQPVMQLPCWHDWLLPVQLWQTAPFAPHALAWFPFARQLVPWQHPEQLLALHPEPPSPFCWQVLFVAHVIPAGHVPTQWLPLQHPLQELALHVFEVSVHRPSRHSWKTAQAAQLWPLVPQALDVLPVWQRPVGSQQPGQLAGPHRAPQPTQSVAPAAQAPRRKSHFMICSYDSVTPKPPPGCTHVSHGYLKGWLRVKARGTVAAHEPTRSLGGDDPGGGERACGGTQRATER